MGVNTTDEIYIEAPPEEVQRALVGLSSGAAWWPGARVDGAGERVRVDAPIGGALARRVRFEAAVSHVREREGFTWMLERGELRGRAEWWLEAYKDGTIVHYYLDVERGDRGRARRMSSVVRRHRWAVRRGVNGLKDLLEDRAAARAR